jgi:hypothetical protein
MTVLFCIENEGDWLINFDRFRIVIRTTITTSISTGNKWCVKVHCARANGGGQFVLSIPVRLNHLACEPLRPSAGEKK